MSLNVQINFTYSVNQPTDFVPLLELIAAIQKLGAGVVVETTGVEVTQPSPPATLAGRTRGRPRRANGTEDKDEDRPMRVSGGQAVTPVDVPDVDDDEDVGLEEPSLSDHELKERALGIIRNAYQIKVKDAKFQAEMREMLRGFNAVKFTEITDQDGPKFYKLAVAVAEKLGMRP
jgi:hypothetical protein